MKLPIIEKHAYLDLKRGAEPVVYAISFQHPLTSAKVFCRIKEV